jgi:signal peptidase I
LLIYKLYKKKNKSLTPSVREDLKKALKKTQDSLLTEDREEASRQVTVLEDLSFRYLKKNIFDQTKDFIGAIVFALVIATVVRQMWFEFYSIPTGSMRPTLKEQNGLVVSKTQFGINIPLTAKHAYFNPELVKRNGIVVFTGKDMDIEDVDTMYFYLFPGKKQYIKRLIGKPGDTLYFYGGKIYGLDKHLQDISSELDISSLSLIDHIPFISFEGKTLLPKSPTQGVYSPAILYQMNEPVAKLSFSSNHHIHAELTAPHQTSSHPLKDYDDLWGFKNYGMVRLLNKKDYLMALDGAHLENLKSSEYYLEITHHPSLKTAKLQKDLYGRLRPVLGLNKSYIPLDEAHLKTLFSHLYTARFIVDKEGYAYRYGYKRKSYPKEYLPKLSHIPPGTYEFYYGKAYQVFGGPITQIVPFGGYTKELPSTHPIYQFKSQTIYQLFNLGIEFDKRFLPDSGYPSLYPSRYTFFRDNNLYVMGAPLLLKEEPVLEEFVKQEHHKELLAAPYAPYVPFIDHGSPQKDNGQLDKEFILQHGIKIPEKSYLVLGDNYAMSADSRVFGFVPEDNLRGVPEFIFWPFDKQFGLPNQPHYQIFTLPRILIWILAGTVITIATLSHRRKYRLPITID